MLLFIHYDTISKRPERGAQYINDNDFLHFPIRGAQKRELWNKTLLEEVKQKVLKVRA